MIEIDGSYLEGGGQIIRTATALSAVTGKPCKMTKIRYGRCSPGLQAQHLTSIKAAAMLCNADVSGLKFGSESITFTPGKIKSGRFELDVGTAGSITLVLQTILPIALSSSETCNISVTGGTDVKWSPSSSYFTDVFCANLAKLGLKLKAHIERYGFYPKGGGRVSVKTSPSDIGIINLSERGALEGVSIKSIASASLKIRKVAERQLAGFDSAFSEKHEPKISYVESLSPGSCIHATADYEHVAVGFSSLGEPETKAEDVGSSCALGLKKQLKQAGALDEYMEDQIIPYMALSALKNKRTTKIKSGVITNHTKTNIWVVEKFLPVKFSIGKIIECIPI